MFSKLLVLQFNIHSQEISLGDAIACRNGVQCCLNDSVFRLCSTTSNIILDIHFIFEAQLNSPPQSTSS